MSVASRAAVWTLEVASATGVDGWLAPAGAFLQLSAGQGQNCALASDEFLECWGCGADYDYGQCTAPDGTFVQLETGGYHSCAITSGGAIECWGCGEGADFGQCDPPSGSFSQVCTGILHSCAVGPEGVVQCWGNNGEGQCDVPE